MIRQSSNKLSRDSDTFEVGTSAAGITSHRQNSVSSYDSLSHQQSTHQTSFDGGIPGDCLSPVTTSQQLPNHSHLQKVETVKSAKGEENEEQVEHSLAVSDAVDTSKTPCSHTLSGPLAPANSADSAIMEVSSSNSNNAQTQQSRQSSVISGQFRENQSFSAEEPSSTAAVLGQQSSLAHSAPSSSPMQSAANSTAHNSHESTSAITSTSGTSFHQQHLERIDSLENELERVKRERDALLVENDRLAAQLEMMTAVKQQPRPLESTMKCCTLNSIPGGQHHPHNCTCLTASSALANSTADHPQQQEHSYHQSYCQCDCASCPGAVLTAFSPPPPNSVPLINGEPDLSHYSCSHDSNEAMHGSKSMSSFSSFKTTVDTNLNDEFGALPEHSHYLVQQREQQQRLLNTTTSLAPCNNPHCNHNLAVGTSGTGGATSASAPITTAAAAAISSNRRGSEGQSVASTASSATTSSAATGTGSGRAHKGMLRRESALMGVEGEGAAAAYHHQQQQQEHPSKSPPTSHNTPPLALSPSFSKNSVALSVSLNLSPTASVTSAGTSPLFGFSGHHPHHHHHHHIQQAEEGSASHPHHPHHPHHPPHPPHPHHPHHAHPSSNLLRTVRAGGGSSNSLSAGGSNGGGGGGGAPYGYELSQQLLDKQTSALERKYGGREAREAAITIQRAFRSYRLQKRFTTLAIQAICHQQLKQQKEQEQMKREQQQQQQQQQQLSGARKESVVVEVTATSPLMPKMGEKAGLKVKDSSVSLSPIDREAMQHRFSRKMSANYALDDLVRMQSQLQHQQTLQSTAASGMLPLVQHQQQQQYLSIPRQASPPVTLVTSYEPVYTAQSSGLLYNSSGGNLHSNQHTVIVQQHYQPQNHPHPHHPHPHHHHHHQIDGQQEMSSGLQKKTSFSSTSSGGSSTSLHASSSASSKPSDVHSSMSRLPLSGGVPSNYAQNLNTTTAARSQQQQQQPQLLNKQRMQKNSQQQLQQQQQQQQQQHSSAIHLQSNSSLSVQQQQPSIHRTTSHHMMIAGTVNGNGNGTAVTGTANVAAATGNTVSFAPTVDFATGNAAAAAATSAAAAATTTAEGAVSSSVDAYRKRQYRVGLNLFNKTPSERGIRFLIANGYIEQSESSETQASYVAHFLLTRKGLSRQMIGEYISEPAPFNRQVLKSFCGGVNLTGIIVDEALRSFQVHFRFPGEAQKIERLVESFADRYKECNPGDVLSRDSIFILAFAIIMLNTDLHKPTNIKHRMTPEQWLANLKGVFQEGDLSSQFLLGIYKRIKKQELQTGGDHVTQVLKVQSTIIGKDTPNLCVPHRRLVCYCRLYEIRDLNRREKVGQHQRDVFLFNDLLLITKTTSRSRNGQLAEYQYRSSCPLDGLQVLVFSTAYYPNGIRISRRVDNKIIACFNARNDLDQQRFVDDLQEAINEMDDMEQLRITKSSSLVTLNTLAKSAGAGKGGAAEGAGGPAGPGGGPGLASSSSAFMGGDFQQSSQTVIASPTESYSIGPTSANYSSSGTSGGAASSVPANGCANQSRSAAIASYSYANTK